MAERTRRARNSLTRAEIVAAAREVLSESGAAGFTIRAVGERLGASAMSLYNHVASKDELLDAALDDVLLQLVPALADDPARPASEVLVGFAEAHLALLRAHPWAVPVLLSRPMPGPGATAVGEQYFAVALRGGATPLQAVEVFTGVLAVVYGAAGFLIEPPAASGGQKRSEVDERMLESLSAVFPATATVMPHLMTYGSDAQVRGILTALVGGLMPR
jgi:AcrR family transcriptional regulator